MTEEEIYEFDLNGYIVYRDLIPPADVSCLGIAFRRSLCQLLLEEPSG